MINAFPGFTQEQENRGATNHCHHTCDRGFENKPLTLADRCALAALQLG